MATGPSPGLAVTTATPAGCSRKADLNVSADTGWRREMPGHADRGLESWLAELAWSCAAMVIINRLHMATFGEVHVQVVVVAHPSECDKLHDRSIRYDRVVRELTRSVDLAFAAVTERELIAPFLRSVSRPVPVGETAGSTVVGQAMTTRFRLIFGWQMEALALNRSLPFQPRVENPLTILA